IIGIVTIFFARPLTLIALGDDRAQSLGLPTVRIKLGALLAAVILSALVVGNVGEISFVGLAAPWLARLCGARTPAAQMIWAPPVGAAFLWLADQLAQLAGGGFYEVPTGIITAAIGAPILLLLMRRLRAQSLQANGLSGSARNLRHPWLWIVGGMIALLPFVAVGLSASRTGDGLQFVFDPMFGAFLEWRGPRVLAAVLAGAMLSVAGALLQRLLNNPMASPEVLGVSSGAMLGMIVVAFLVPNITAQWHLAGAAGGAFFTLVLMLLFGKGTCFAPERMLLAGIAVTTLCGALFTVLLATGDPRLMSLMGILAGSTYAVDRGQVIAASFVALPCVIGVSRSAKPYRGHPPEWKPAQPVVGTDT
ncbi:MAG: iron chelate uptake ABC transporter family permease subunit, partial [Rickettsia endosymbiont of Ixodes persulcatus]|nr:iron chelate uptake ABC transporter family permease subunit [Rickettsia endosymbiont of Ixodes persulcatus]